MSTRIRPHAVVDGERFAAASEFVIVHCYSCGIPYAIPGRLYESAKRWHGDQPNGWRLHCPLGHEWWYVGENELERTKRLLEQERDRRGRLASRLEQTEASLRGQKIAKSRFKNERDRLRTRAAAGVCPCCNRTFQQLARHMRGQHPDYPTDTP